MRHRDFQDRLLRAMEAAGLDHSALAKRIGSKQPVVSRYLDRKREVWPAGPIMTRLPIALGVSAHWLLTGNGPMTPPTIEESQVFERGIAEGQRRAARVIAEALSSLVAKAAGEDAEMRALAELIAAEGLLGEAPPAHPQPPSDAGPRRPRKRPA